MAKERALIERLRRGDEDALKEAMGMTTSTSSRAVVWTPRAPPEQGLAGQAR